jgi:short-subunit dehydrogenase
MDVTQDSATDALDRLIERLGDVDLLLFASGIGRQNRALDEHIELSTVQTNCEGMVRIIDHFINHVRHNPAYTARRKAHVAVITSVAGTMGIGTAPAYSATKKMQSTYLVALSQLIRMERLPITLSDIRPGFVRTEIPMARFFGGEIPMSRSEARRLGALLSDFRVAELDFTGVSEVGPDFAHELFAVLAGQVPTLRLLALNTEPAVAAALRRAGYKAPVMY